VLTGRAKESGMNVLPAQYVDACGFSLDTDRAMKMMKEDTATETEKLDEFMHYARYFQLKQNCNKILMG